MLEGGQQLVTHPILYIYIQKRQKINHKMIKKIYNNEKGQRDLFLCFVCPFNTNKILIT